MSALTDTTNTINTETEVVGKVANDVGSEKTEVVESPTTVSVESVVDAPTENVAESAVKTEAQTENTADSATKDEAEVTETTAKDNVQVEKVVDSAESDKAEADAAKLADPKNDVQVEKVVDSAESDKAEAEAAKLADPKNEAQVETAVESAVEEVSGLEKTSDAVTETPSAEATEVQMETDDKEVPVEDVKADVVVEQNVAPAEEDMEATEVVAEETKEEKQKKLDEHLVAGRRFIQTSEYDKATEMLSIAAALSAEIFGETHEDAFEATFLYGQTLLELAKVEDGILTNALTDIPKNGDGEDEVQDDIVENPDNVPEEEREEIKQKVGEALAAVSEATIEEEPAEAETTDAAEDKNDEQNQENGDASSTEDVKVQDETRENAEDVEMEVAEGEDQEQDQEESDGEAEEVEDPMKLAWEIIETARFICDKKIKSLQAEEKSDAETMKVWILRKADVLTTLGEHGIADSKHEQAQTDLIEAIELQSAHLDANSRLLANTNHLLGKAFSGESLFERAATHFSNAKNILIAKAEELKKQLETAGEEAKKEIESEIKELEEVIPDLESLITDALASEETTKKIKDQVKKELESAAVALNKLSSEETNDITSMVRRPTKRPATEDEPVEEAKKRKSEDASPAVPSETAMEVTEESGVAPTAAE